MEWERDLTVDDRETRFVETAQMIARLEAILVEDLEWFDTAQVFTADGCRNLSEWVGSRLDIGSDTARTMVRTMRRTADKPWIRQALADGAISFDRAEALSRIDENVGTLDHLDISGLRREAADRVELTSEDEAKSAQDRYLIIQPSLDESWWTLRGGLDGVTGAVIDQALTKKADDLPDLPMVLKVRCRGGKQPPYTNSHQEVLLPKHMSPCSSTPRKPPQPTAKPASDS